MIDTIQRELIAEGITQARQKIKGIQDQPQRRKKLFAKLDEVESILLNLASLNEISPTSLDIKHYNVEKLLISISGMYGSFFKKHGIDFKVFSTAHLNVSVDQTAFFRIFFNLVYYMAQHTNPAGGSVIQIEARAYNEELVAIYVEDNGNYPVGIDESVFNSSYSKRVLNAIAGIGLGAIKEWITSLRGSIQMVEKLGPGIKCCLLLPQRSPKQTRRAFAPRLHSTYKIFKVV